MVFHFPSFCSLPFPFLTSRPPLRASCTLMLPVEPANLPPPTLTTPAFRQTPKRLKSSCQVAIQPGVSPSSSMHRLVISLWGGIPGTFFLNRPYFPRFSKTILPQPVSLFSLDPFLPQSIPAWISLMRDSSITSRVTTQFSYTHNTKALQANVIHHVSIVTFIHPKLRSSSSIRKLRYK